jgi:glucose/arabinose dehydrogenase
VAAALGAGVGAIALGGPPASGAPASPFGDWRGERPGAVHKIVVSDLPEPNRTRSVDNGPKLVPRPSRAWPQAPAGFEVQLYASGLTNPRLARTAPNGDVFVVESRPGELRLLRGLGPDGRARESVVFARGFKKPFGIAFYPPGNDPRWLYVANTDSVVRLPYHVGERSARGPVETVVPELPGGGLLRGGGHWTRDIAFSGDGKQMWISVGSRSNNDDVDDNPAERERADILVFEASGAGRRVFASGIRNAVGIAVHPRSGELWASVNERDELGDDLVPDYITHVQEGGFYGWPWFYMGGRWDPRHRGKHPERRAQVITPDVLIQPHDASLQMTFYDGRQFPDGYRGDIFAAEHGSWNRAARSGYEVIRVPMHGKDRASGEYEDFLTGFVTPDGGVWGRPVGVTVTGDGSLLVTDDGSNSVWRVSYTGKGVAPQPASPPPTPASPPPR